MRTKLLKYAYRVIRGSKGEGGDASPKMTRSYDFYYHFFPPFKILKNPLRAPTKILNQKSWIPACVCIIQITFHILEKNNWKL